MLHQSYLISHNEEMIVLHCIMMQTRSEMLILYCSEILKILYLLKWVVVEKIKNKSLMQSTVMVQIMELSSQILHLILKNTIILSMFLQKHFHFYNWLCSKIHRFLMKLLLKDLSFLLK